MRLAKKYFAKMKGNTKCPAGVSLKEIFWSWLGSLIGIGFCAYLSSYYFEPRELPLLFGPLGASAVLVFAASKSPLAQPRNLVGGHLIAGLIGVTAYQLFGRINWLAAALAVSFAIAAMLATKTLHPPAGATALIAVTGGERIHALGFLYPFLPAGTGAFILLLVALLFNNLLQDRKYPEYWF